ncbi:MAG: tRNA uridine-5-carboxymethylaminomethyl(34) synthesis GTPase MnmE [Clostridiales bacterium 38-18]|nr:MAG: tRNA uridine-5-carboxymethylaminomethyl(34) synthesis GTPase MnmE [Clostridiales bacterium 38-18]
MITDTIVAISTPIGEGAIGIVRMSGPESFEILDAILKTNQSKLNHRELVYGHIIKDEKIIDEVMAVKMYAPKTYTKENMVEINCHGGILSVKEVLALCIIKGARLAEKGEFTQRAFLNGRIDLAQAESIMDLISAKTKTGFSVAMNQLDGVLSRKIKSIRNQLIATMAQIEVGIDYPEEDIEEITYQQIIDELIVVKDTLNQMLANAENGKIIREGLKTAIIGKPNVGKSSLMNALLKDSRAIVTEIAGTTRDLIEEFMNIGGIPIKLIDTAGIRETADIVEKIGVERSKAAFNEADLIIFMLNASEALTDEDLMLMSLVKDRHALVIINKTDLEIVIDEAYINSHFEDKIVIRTSLELEQGIEDVEKSIQEIVFGKQFEINNDEIVSNSRHIALLNLAYKNIVDAIHASNDRMPYDFIEVDIKDSITHLGHITGEAVEKDLLNSIFSNFCLGK